MYLKLNVVAWFAVGLAGVAAAQTPISVSLTTNENLSNTIWMSQTVPTPTQDPITYIGAGFGNLEAGTITFEVEPAEGVILDPYTFVGEYAEDQLSIGLRPEVAEDAIANGKTWDQVFSVTSEAELAGYLAVLGAPDPEDPFAILEAGLGAKAFFEANKNLFPSFGVTSTMVKFSAATNGGSVFAQPVPEPSTLALLALGGWALARRRR